MSRPEVKDAAHDPTKRAPAAGRFMGGKNLLLLWENAKMSCYVQHFLMAVYEN